MHVAAFLVIRSQALFENFTISSKFQMCSWIKRMLKNFGRFGAQRT